MLKGLANYASRHGDIYDRIDAVIEIDSQLLALDLRSEPAREAISRIGDGGVRDLFEKLGGNYS